MTSIGVVPSGMLWTVKGPVPFNRITSRTRLHTIVGQARIRKFGVSNDQPAVQVVTQKGMIVVGAHQPLLAYDGSSITWKRAIELRPGHMCVLVPQKEYTTSHRFVDFLCWIMGITLLKDLLACCTKERPGSWIDGHIYSAVLQAVPLPERKRLVWIKVSTCRGDHFVADGFVLKHYEE